MRKSLQHGYPDVRAQADVKPARKWVLKIPHSYRGRANIPNADDYDWYYKMREDAKKGVYG